MAMIFHTKDFWAFGKAFQPYLSNNLKRLPSLRIGISWIFLIRPPLIMSSSRILVAVVHLPAIAMAISMHPS
jgi:hypothetical protein